MKKRSLLIISILAIVIASIGIYNYVYKNHRDIASETSSYKLSSKTLIDQFSVNPTDFESKYLNKTIEVKGLITNLNPTNVTLNDKVFCLFTNSINESLKSDAQTKIKGRFIGYDDLLEQIKLDQCTIIK